MRTLLVTLLALLPVPVAGAVGPWLGTSTDGVGYSVVAAAETTTVSHAADKFTLDGSWGLPRVTLNGAVGGLSPDGGTLVLAAQVPVDGTLRTKTDFAILATSPLRLRRIVHLRGDFGFDA